MSTIRQQLINAVAARLEGCAFWGGSPNVKPWRTTDVGDAELAAGPVVAFACEFEQEETVSQVKHRLTVSVDLVMHGPQTSSGIWDNLGAIEAAMLQGNRRWDGLASGTMSMAPAFRVEQAERLVSVATQQFVIWYETARAAC